MHGQHARSAVLLAFTLVILTFPGTVAGGTGLGAVEGSAGQASGVGGDCTLHPPIRILDDAMFRLGPAVGVVNPTANGTAEDPYVIEGWCITPQVPARVESMTTLPGDPAGAHVESAGILIRDTGAHVVVRNTTVHGFAVDIPVVGGQQAAGIQVANAANVTVANNTLVDNRVGVHASGSQTLIVDNTVTLGDRFGDAGVHLSMSRGAITGNTVMGYDGPGIVEGIHLLGSDASIVDNTVTDNGAGILLEEASHATVETNTVTDNIDGVRIADGEGSLTGNTIRSNGDGVHLGPMVNATLVGNTVTENGDGVRLTGANHVLIADNVISHNGLFDGAGVLGEVTEVMLRGNAIEGNGEHGVHLDPVADVTLRNNTVADHGREGVVLAGPTHASLTGNDIARNDVGVELRGPGEVTIRSNTVTENDWNGIFLDSGDEVVLEGNTVADHGHAGVFLTEPGRVTLSDSTLRGNAWGVALSQAGPTALTNNTIAGNSAYGVFMEYGESTTLESNDIVNNRDGVKLKFATDATLTRNNIEGNADVGLTVFDSAPVDATGNWWGAASGPSGGVADACTGTTADGAGDVIDTSWSLGPDGDVCFDPWLQEPVETAGAS